MKIILGFLLALASIAASAANPEKHTIPFEGKERTYYAFAPEKLAERAGAEPPLLLLLHGSGRDGMSQINEWKELAEKEGLVLVAPDSLNSREWSMGVDGPEFLHTIVEATRARYPVDGKRIYLFGHSAGAVFALYMGVMESEYFAAAGGHAGAMKEDFYPSLDLARRKLPLAIWVGTDDPYFSLTLVHNTQGELKKHGFDAQVFEMKDHDHNYYAVSKELNPKIWSFFAATRLEANAKWQTYQAAKPKKIRVSSGVAAGLILHKVPPEYPEEAKEQHITGDVFLRLLINRQGEVANIEVLQGNPVLAVSATKAVQQWKYKPFLLNGEPVEIETQVTVSFHM